MDKSKRLVVLALLLAGCSAPAATPVPTAVTHVLAGTLKLTQAHDIAHKTIDHATDRVTACAGTGGFSDIADGAQVIIWDAGGVIVGSAAIVTAPGIPSSFGSECDYTFSATIPDSTFYTIEIANRKGPTYQRSDLESNGWQVGLTLGG